MRISSIDLLPVIFDEIVKLYIRKNISQLEREKIIFALYTSLQLSVLLGTNNKELISDSKEKANNHTLYTSDRFCSEKLSRREIISRIQDRSGLTWKLSHISLLLIEAQIDVCLSSAKNLTIENFAVIVNNEIYSQSKTNFWVEKVLDTTYRKISTPYCWKLWHLFKSPPNHLTTIVDALESSLIYRTPISYKIKLLSTQQYKNEQIKEKRMIWERAFDECELLPLPKEFYD